MTRRHIALKEMRESQFWLRLLCEANPVKGPHPLVPLVDESGQLVAILTATLNTAKRNDREARKRRASTTRQREPDTQ